MRGMEKPSKQRSPRPVPPEDAEEDLWFLPGPEDDADQPHAMPGPKVDRRPLFPVADWRAAVAALAGDLAALAHDAGRLEERLSQMGEGARQRLAIQEAAALGWWTGDRVGADRLALWLSLHLAGVGDEAQVLARLSWAVRRLAAAPLRAPLQAPLAGRLAAELGLQVGETDRLTDVAEVLDGAEGLPALALGALGFHLMQLAGDSPAQRIEAAVLGARLAGGSLGFLPLSLAGLGALTVSGTAERRLSGWIGGAHHAVLAALLHLDRLRRWQDRATEAVADMSGRTPARLVAALARLPMLSAPVAEGETGASRAAVQRNLDRLSALGLVREITGQGRYRVWTAVL